MNSVDIMHFEGFNQVMNLKGFFEGSTISIKIYVYSTTLFP